jgi:hypothetical protein
LKGDKLINSSIAEDDRKSRKSGELMHEPDKKNAVVINIQSWATPIVGMLMLVVGLAAGYIGRPLLPFDGQSGASESQPTAVSEADTPLPDPSSTESLMDLLVSQARHFKGDIDAPITMIEFSDFK